MEHEKRDHALLSASSAHRWLACTPSAKLEEQFPDTTSEAAREGTLAHELAELKLRSYFYTTDFGKRKLNAAIKKLQKEELWQEEMMGYTDLYLDYIKTVALADRTRGTAEIEKRVDFGQWMRFWQLLCCWAAYIRLQPGTIRIWEDSSPYLFQTVR